MPEGTDDRARPPGAAIVAWNPPDAPVTAFVRRATDLGLGMTSLAVGATAAVVERVVPGAGPAAPTGAGRRGLLRMVPGAVLGLGLAAQRRVLELTAAAERAGNRAGASLVRAPVVGAPARAAEGYLGSWYERAGEAQARSRSLVTDLARRLAPEVATAVVRELDVGRLVEQLPIDEILAQVDIDAILSRVDVDAIVRRVDVDAIVGRVDIDGIMNRVDVDAIVRRVDVVPLAQEVIQEIDIGSIVRESTGSIGGEVIDGGRVNAMRLDNFVARVADRALFRHRARDVRPAGPRPPEAEPPDGRP